MINKCERNTVKNSNLLEIHVCCGLLPTMSTPPHQKGTGQGIHGNHCACFSDVRCRLAYCNAVYAMLLQTITNRLQRVMNAAVQVVSDTGKFDRGLKTTLHYELHWLDVGEDWVQTGCDSVPVSAWTSTSAPCWPPHPSLWCCSLPSSTMICEPEPSHCALLST